MFISEIAYKYMNNIMSHFSLIEKRLKNGFKPNMGHSELTEAITDGKKQLL